MDTAPTVVVGGDGSGAGGTPKDPAYTKGVVFEGSTGTVYGDVTLPGDVIIPEGYILTIPDGASLTIPEGCALTNNGTIKLEGTGTLSGDGQLNGNGTPVITWHADNSGAIGQEPASAPVSAGAYWVKVSAAATGFYEEASAQKRSTISSVQLPAPGTAQWQDGVLGRATWSAVDGAEGYSVQLYKDGVAVGAPVTVRDQLSCDLDIGEEGSYSFVVKALGNGDHTDSEGKESGHWKECTCGEKVEQGEHTFQWVIDREATTAEKGEKHEECTVCGYKKEAVEIPVIPTYPPEAEKPEGGEVEVTPEAPQEGETVTITPKPEEGHEVEDVTVTDEDGNEIPVTENEDGTYTFTQPEGQVTIDVEFTEKTGSDEPPHTGDTASLMVWHAICQG